MHVVKWLAKCAIIDFVLMRLIMFLWESNLPIAPRVTLQLAIVAVAVFINIVLGFSNKIGTPDAISLTWKRFYDLYNLNPGSYELGLCNIYRKYTEQDESNDIKPMYIIWGDYGHKSYTAIIRLSSLMQYIKYYIWKSSKNRLKFNKDVNEKYQNYLKACNVDIDIIRKRAEEQINKAREETDKIGLRLNKKEKGKNNEAQSN